MRDKSEIEKVSYPVSKEEIKHWRRTKVAFVFDSVFFRNYGLLKEKSSIDCPFNGSY
ncbi:TPA: hypothetical protein HA338_04780 [Methanosarcina acetivorans]|uniref:Uncharacterized protein n=1 Tax=Methanosarcina acetivorans TaxID=2214 RepID=A0A832S8Q3_9EURY|nr:hypothetical protein [Methanosarcina acetivorans]HIH93368.1 hypothetical protein [Methanosarcina acetivorans]